MQDNSADFLIEAMKNLSSSLDLNIVLENTFKFLQKHFPIEAFAMHRFIEEKKSLQVLFFVNSNGYHAIEKFYPLNKSELNKIIKIEQGEIHKNIGFDSFHINTPDILDIFLKKHYIKLLKNKNPAMLAMTFSPQDKTIGHLLIFSKSETKFTLYHEKLFLLLKEAFASAMINIHRYQEIVESKQELIVKNKYLNQNIEKLTHTDIIGNSQSIKKVIEMVHLLALKNVQILILGETGTGKEVIADLIQRNSMRKDKVFIKVNCGAIPESLIDSELFGYEKGAFTGAYETKEGYFEQAKEGTLFLDEIGELSMQAQVRLLRVLQFGLVERVGGKKSIPVDTRIIAATNRNLEHMLQQGTFREDLYYRLHAFPITIPSLRERKDDIILLLQYFTKKISERLNIDLPEIDFKNIERLQKYTWPGNVRELENLVERTIILNPYSKLNFAEYLPKDPLWYLDNMENDSNYSLKNLIFECLKEIKENTKNELKEEIIQELIVNKELFSSDFLENKEENTIKSLEHSTRMHIIEALKQSKGKVSGKNSASEILNMNSNTLRKKIQKLGINCNKLWE